MSAILASPERLRQRAIAYLGAVPILPASHSRRVAWKNGRGSTLEIASDAAAIAGEWTWRLSIAEIPERAAFSHFPGVDRLIGLLHGEALMIERDGKPQVVPGVGAALAFAGEEDVIGVPAGSVVRDANLMMRRELWRGAMELLRAGSRIADAPLVVIHAAAGSITLESVHEPKVKSLQTGETLQTRGKVSVECPNGSIAILCELRPRGEIGRA